MVKRKVAHMVNSYSNLFQYILHKSWFTKIYKWLYGPAFLHLAVTCESKKIGMVPNSNCYKKPLFFSKLEPANKQGWPSG